MAVVDYTSVRVSAAPPLTKAGHGVVCVSYGTVEIATIGDATSVYTMCKIPGNSLIVGGYIAGDTTLEANATETLVLDIGITGAATAIQDAVACQINDASAFIGTGLPSQVYSPFALANGAYDVGTDDVNLIVTVETAATTTGTGTLSAVVYYTQKLYPVPA